MRPSSFLRVFSNAFFWGLAVVLFGLAAWLGLRNAGKKGDAGAVPKNTPVEVKARCPVEPLDAVPPALAGVFRDGDSTQARIDALQSFAEKHSATVWEGGDAKAAEQHQTQIRGLRWMMHQADVDESLRNELANLFTEWNEPTLVNDLLGMSRDEAQKERWRAWCLQHLTEYHLRYKDQASLAGLERSLGSGNETVRRQALFSLSKLGQELNWRESDPGRFQGLVAKIAEDLKKQNAQAVANAIDSAARLRLKEVVSELEKLAVDPKGSAQLRVPAINALAAIGDPDSRASLEQCLHTGDRRITDQANFALRKLSKQNK